ncbi:MAG TPA: CHAT domain-containing protein [Longimicrobium sp.]|nr:CHAT domain-containing protein [Longimicrobium sp.]
MPGEALVARVRCGEALERGTWRFRHLSAAAAELRRRHPPGDRTARLRASALWHLRREDGTALASATVALERAAAHAPTDPRVLNDLAVVYLEQGAREQALEPMLRALDAVERAVAVDSLMAEALYNRALIHERLYLVNTAREAWTRYAAVEPDAAWRAEARERARALEPSGDTTAWWPLVDGSPALEGRRRVERIAPRVARAPQEARNFSFKLLGRWGEAVLAGDHGESARLLGWGRDIGATAQALGGDRTVALAVRTIDGALHDPARLRALAEAHVALDSGAQFYTARPEAAVRTLSGAEARFSASHSAMAGWAAYFRAAALINCARYEAADTVLRRLATGTGPLQPALAGRATWARGTSRVRRGLYDEAGQFYRAARPYFLHAREREYEGATRALLSESLSLTGQYPAARTEAYGGLRLLSAFPGSSFYNLQLTTVAAEARGKRLRHAVLAVLGEKVRVARLNGSVPTLAQALRARAHDRMALGDTAGARADVADAIRQARTLDRGAARDRVTADVEVVLAEMEAARDARSALARLGRAIDIYHAQRLGVYLPTALYEAAAISRALGDLDGAHRYLDEAVGRIEALQDSALTAETRATRLETVETVFDAAIALQLERGRPGEAFAYLERARLAAWPRNERGIRPADVGPERLAPAAFAPTLPAGTLLLEYAVLHDRLVIWAVSRRGVRQFAAPVTRDSVARLVGRFARDGYESTSSAGAGARLFDLLVRPVAGELRGIRHLAIVPDRELNQLPFAALRNGTAGPRLVERYSIGTLPSTAFYLAARARAATRPARAGRALVVGNPAIDSLLGLPALPGAEREAEAVARLRAPATLLMGARASRATLLRHLPGHTLLHFAGHAVFNAESPELSYLALAPDGAGGPGILPAWEIAHLPASNLVTVVLSACSTLNPRPTHAGAPAGLAYSFLRAGAPSTVSTLWDVSDQATTGVLVEFHRLVAGGTPPAEALRRAQVAALRSGSAMRVPGAWAAFIYTGP